jgi:hypothetical protein
MCWLCILSHGLVGEKKKEPTTISRILQKKMHRSLSLPLQEYPAKSGTVATARVDQRERKRCSSVQGDGWINGEVWWCFKTIWLKIEDDACDDPFMDLSSIQVIPTNGMH